MKTILENKKKIFIVDDNNENIRIIGSILRENAFQVGFATGGLQALDILDSQAEDYDLVLLDVNMPGINGFEVCEKIRENERLKEIPVIFLTANSEPEHIIEGFASGGQDYVTKPFHSGELLSRINTHIELKESREQLKQMNAILEEKVNLRTLELFEANQKLKDVNQELERLDIAKSDFLKLISHEINTPLNSIIGFAQILKDELSSSEYFHYIEYLMESANRLQLFAQDSIEITRMRTSPEKYQKEEINILRILEEIVYGHTKLLEQKSLRPKFNVTVQTPLIEGNDELIRMCLKHVFRNAIHYSSDGGEINIEIKSAGHKLMVAFSDNGPGFSLTALKSLFKPFSPGEKHIDENKGLGLFLVKMVVDFHHAQILVSNKNGNGAQVELIFDRIDSQSN
jgi:two-component system, sensor histidine kinase and response regulator